MNIDIEETQSELIYKTTQKILIQIIDTQDKETLKSIERYCEENDIIPELIDKDKLDLVLRLGIQALNEREW